MFTPTKRIAGHPAFQIAGLDIRRAESVTCWEGLPHPMFEDEALRTELASKNIIRLGGEPFYAQPLVLDPADVERLRDLCADGEHLFVSTTPYTFCGGFHADYALRFACGERNYDFLFCFGCGEVRVLGAEAPLHLGMYVDVFGEILQRYRSLRPARG